MIEGLFAAYQALAVPASERERETGARRGQRLETERGQDRKE
jgi:hypothetical protein